MTAIDNQWTPELVTESSKQEEWHSLLGKISSLTGLFTEQISVSLISEKTMKNKFIFFWISFCSRL